MKAGAHGQVVAALWVAAAGAAQAAGGHHAVDDAALLDPGTCHVETWASHRAAGGTLWHFGPACRGGPLEWGLALERQTGASALPTAAQVKWAVPVGGGVAVGLLAGSSWGRFFCQGAGSSVGVPVTWSSDDWAVHLNLGRDFVRGGASSRRWGVAAERSWGDWTLLAERFAEAGRTASRLGVRWALDPAWSVDLSVATAHPASERLTTLGATWTFPQ